MPKNETSFKFGNTAWRARSSHGRKPIFANPEDLEAACHEYFQWVEDNPLMSAELVKYEGRGNIEAVPKMRAMTMQGLCNFLDIDTQTWTNYKERADFIGIIKRIEHQIYCQKVEGAAAGMLNANIIAREVGLTDKTETVTKGVITHIESEYVEPES